MLAASFIGTAVSPGKWAAHLQMPFMLASTVMGYLIGTAVPTAVSTVLHPLVTCALVANLGAFAYTTVSGLTFDSIAKSYLAKVCPPVITLLVLCGMCYAEEGSARLAGRLRVRAVDMLMHASP